MKTIGFVPAALVALLCVLPAAAQTAAKDDSGGSQESFYYVNVPIEKVYPHRLGYFILYRKGGSELGQAYLPISWFTQSAGKGEFIRLPSGPDWPYLSVFYKGGKFSHVRLFVANSYAHQSWGNLPSSANLDDKFNIEELNLEY